MTFSSYGELAGELEPPEISPIDPDDIDYVTDRRHILGPAADISHPEFGRPNRPEENFRVLSDVVYPDDNHFRTQVTQRVFDAEGNVVSVKEESPDVLVQSFLRSSD